MAGLITIERRNKSNGFWEQIEITKITTSCNEIVVGGTFRILVDGKIVHVEERVNAHA